MKTFAPLLALAFMATACAGVDGDADGFVDSVDCDDDNASIFPGAVELCDGVDNNCNGIDDDPYAGGGQVFFIDEDGDGFGTAKESAVACSVEDVPGFVADASDCDDDDDGVYPTAPELCNLVDDNCNGTVDDDPDDAPTWYADYDADGFGSRTLVRKACEGPTGWIKNGGDCNDFDFFISPNAVEMCDRIDNDCDDVIDEADAEDHSVFFRDSDGDGAGDARFPIDACWLPDGYAVTNDDCNDDPTGTEFGIDGSLQTPGVEEVCQNGYDDNCDGDGNQCWFTTWEDTSDALVSVEGFSGGYMGYHMAPVGDVDGDGYEDLLLGSYYANCGSGLNGCATILYGDPEGTWVEPKFKAKDLGSFTTQTSYDYTARSVDGVGDLDGDGYDDMIIGSYSFDTAGYSGNGAVFVVYGSSDRVMDNVEMEGAGTPYLYGETSTSYLGYAVARAGDVNSDTYPDFMGGAYYYNYDGKFGAGAVYVFPGSPGRYSGPTSAGSFAKFVGNVAYAYLGNGQNSLHSGDLNGDGRSDLTMGSYGVDSYAGAAYIVYGTGAGWTGTQEVESAYDVKLNGPATYTYIGQNLTVPGDINDDGYDDLVVGDYRASSYAGTCWVYFGGKSQISSGEVSSRADASVTGEAGSDYLCYGRPALGDVDNNGVPELIVGGYYVSNGTGGYGNGGAYVVEAGASLVGDVTLSSPGAYKAKIVGPNTNYAYFGYNTAVADMNGDGFDDVFVAAYGDAGYAGKVYGFMGNDW